MTGSALGSFQSTGREPGGMLTQGVRRLAPAALTRRAHPAGSVTAPAWALNGLRPGIGRRTSAWIAKMKQSRIQAVDHVNLEAHIRLAEDVRRFYTEIALLDEVPCSEVDPPRLSFISERIELRVALVEKPWIEPVACRVTIAVPSLAETAELLEERRIPYEPLSGLSFTDRRLEMHDPAGNRMALKQAWPDGPF